MSDNEKHIVTIHITGDKLDDLMYEIREATKAVEGLVILERISDHLQLETEQIEIKIK